MYIIQTNPYRIFGICSNSPVKERVSNRDRLKAFLKVGKQVSFPMDLPSLLPAIHRSAETIAQADAKLTLPEEQLHYAQFWFIKASSFDEIALNHLIAGNINSAISIWSKREDASSLQNRIVCSLIQNNLPLVMSYAERLYSLYVSDFIQIVLGDNATISNEHLEYGFIDILCQEYGNDQVLSQTSNEEWKKYIRTKSVQPLMDILRSAMDTAKLSKGKGSDARLNAGTKLMNDTKSTLKQLKTFLPDTDLQYQMLADKLGIEILQCGIDYYNDSEEPDAAHKAMVLQSYAQSIVVGKMAKERCDENVKTLKTIIDELPPLAVYDEDQAIKEELSRFSQLPDKICHAVDLLKNCEGHLLYMRSVLGSTDAYYLKISTLVVNAALYNVIEEVNGVQSQLQIDVLIDREKAISVVESILKVAQEATRLMSTFDMEADFRSNRFDENERVLQGLCSQVDKLTSVNNTVGKTPPTVNSKPWYEELGCLGWTTIIVVIVSIIVGSIYGLEGLFNFSGAVCGLSVLGAFGRGSEEIGFRLICLGVAAIFGLIAYGLSLLL